MNTDIDLIPYIKTNSKLITDLNIKYETIELLENSIGENLDDHGCGKYFLNTTAEA